MAVKRPKHRVFEAGGQFITVGYPTMEFELMALRGAGVQDRRGYWRFPATFESYYHLVLHYPLDLVFDKASVLRVLDLELAQREPVPRFDWTFKTPNRAHQERGFYEAVAHPRFALWWEQGLGKTKTILDVIGYRYAKGQIKNCLVLMPKSLLASWSDQIQEHSYLSHIVVDGSAARRRRLLETPSQVHLFGYDGARCLELSSFSRWDYVVCDESKAIANATSKRSKEVQRLAKAAAYLSLMSGTPVGNSLVDYYGQYKAIDPSIFGTSKFGFEQIYCVKGGFEGRQVIGYKRVGQLISKTRAWSLRETKEHCLDLPGKVRTVTKVTLSPAQEKVYNDVKQELVAEIDGGTITANMAAARLNKLCQICSGFIHMDDGTWKIFNTNPKLDALMDKLDDFRTGRGAVVWCFFQRSFDVIGEQLNKAGFTWGRISGVESLPQRRAAMQDFQRGDVQVLLASLSDAAAAGLNLQANSNHAFFYDQVWSVTTRAQAEDRLHRIGQEHTVFLDDLVCKGKADAYVAEQVREKRAFASVVTDGTVSKELLERI